MTDVPPFKSLLLQKEQPAAIKFHYSLKTKKNRHKRMRLWKKYMVNRCCLQHHFPLVSAVQEWVGLCNSEVKKWERVGGFDRCNGKYDCHTACWWWFIIRMTYSSICWYFANPSRENYSWWVEIFPLFTRLRSRRVVMCLVVVFVRSFVPSFPHRITSI